MNFAIFLLFDKESTLTLLENINSNQTLYVIIHSLFPCSNSTTETPEQYVKSVHSEQ